MFAYRIIHSRLNQVIFQSMNWEKTVSYLKDLNGAEENRTYLILREKVKIPIQETKVIITETQGADDNVKI